MLNAGSQRSSEPNGSASPMLEVISGLHRGVKLSLTNASYRIGSSPDSDIVLRDSGVAGHHATINIEGDHVKIETGDTPIILGNGKELPASHGYRVRLPLTFSIGEASMRLSGGPQPYKKVGGFSLATPAMALGVLVAAVSVLVLVGLLSKPDAPQDSAAKPDASASKQIVAEAPPALPAFIPAPLAPTPQPVAEKATETAEDIGQKLRQKLQEADMRLLRVTPLGSEIHVTGAIRKEQQGAWVNIVAWFDKTFAGRSTLVPQVTADKKPPKPPVALKAIWFGDNPYMIAGDGKRYYEGAFLNNGWVVRAIKQDRIILARGDEQLSLTY